LIFIFEEGFFRNLGGSYCNTTN